ncbi:MAG: hypothetical protein H6813_00675 [Phycisphaeraceae bacterium]|nr:hypothetical protein [Phycisphaeraceae bacterium]
MLATSRMFYYFSIPMFVLGGIGCAIFLMDPLYNINNFDSDLLIILAITVSFLIAGGFFIRQGIKTRRPRRVLLINESARSASITMRWGSKLLEEHCALDDLKLTIHNARFVDIHGREGLLTRFPCSVILIWINELWFVLGGDQDREKLIHEVRTALPPSLRDRLTDGVDIVSKGLIR